MPTFELEFICIICNFEWNEILKNYWGCIFRQNWQGQEGFLYYNSDLL